MATEWSAVFAYLKSQQYTSHVTPHQLQKNGQELSFEPLFSTPLALLKHWSNTSPEKTALVFDDPSQNKPQEWNFVTLSDLVRQTKKFLDSFVFVKTVAFCFSNTPEVILLNYAAWSSNRVTVPLDSTRDTTERKIYKLKLTKAELYITRDDEATRRENAEIQKVLPKLQIVETKDCDDFCQSVADVANTEQNKANAKGVDPEAVDPDRAALVLFTSGTTALPKGAVLTWRSLMANAASIAGWLQFDATDRWLVTLPLHHINSTTFVNTTYLSGATVVLIPKYSKSQFWPTLAKNGVTGTSIVPTIAFDQLSEEEGFKNNRENLKQVRRIQIGSAPVQPTNVRQFIEKYGIKLCQGYGQTETSLRSTGVPLDLTDEQYRQMVDANSVGTELAYTNVTILRSDGSEAAADEIGDICVRGPIIMREYLANPDATEDAFAHNWFHSGDLGFWHEYFGRRFFFLKGRSKEIIKKGGVLISPLAIENALLQHFPQLKQVFVIGIPDARLGEEIGFVAIGDDPHLVQQILAEAKQNKIVQLKDFETPRAGMLISADQLPLTSTGKVQRVELKKRYADQLQLQTLFVAETNQYLFRLIAPEETEVLQQALTINNQRWGATLSATLPEFVERAAHGILLGMFNKTDSQLLGTVSGLQLSQKDLEKIGTQNHWANTWDGITDSGQLHHHSPKGNCLVLVAISVAGIPDTTQAITASCPPHSLETVVKYCESGSDPVLSFHAKPKAGLASGAAVYKVLPEGRTADWQACGYSVVMQYPPLSQTPTINTESSKGTQLLEAAFVFAHQQKIAQVFAYSRPSGLRDYLS